MSQRRVRETSAGDSGIALLMGSSACSMRSRRAGLFSACRDCTLPRARRRAPRTDPGLTTAAPKKKTALATATKMITTINRGDIGVLYLDPDNLPDHEITDGLQGDSRNQKNMADGIREERVNKGGIQHQHQSNDDRRHAHQKGHGQASLSCVHAHLALDLESFTDDIREIVENLCEGRCGPASPPDRG